jgi:hypothetical protein
MPTEDDLVFMTFHLPSHLNPNPTSEPAQPANETAFPAELLDSGFELTEILTS